jgi:hypothetical protein
MQPRLSDNSGRRREGKASESSSIMPKVLYEVVSPLGEPAAEKRTSDACGKSASGKIAPAPSLRDLNGKKIGLIWTALKNGDLLLEDFQDLLSNQFEKLEFVKLPGGKGQSWAGHPDESVADVAKEAGLDAVIAAVGG